MLCVKCLNMYHKSSAIAEMARVFLVNLDHGYSRNPSIFCGYFLSYYDRTTLRCPSLNPLVECYGTRPWIQSEMLWYLCQTSTHSWYQNVALLDSDYGTITSYSVPQQSSSITMSRGSKPSFNIQTIIPFGRGSLVRQRDRQTDRQTDGIAIAIAASNTLNARQ